MSLIPQTKVQAAAFAVTMAALGAFILIVAQAIALIHCPIVAALP